MFRVRQTAAMSTCATCEHFDKAAWPKNPHFGKCNYILPNLPKWVQVTQPQYRSVSIGLRDCATYSQSDAAGKP